MTLEEQLTVLDMDKKVDTEKPEFKIFNELALMNFIKVSRENNVKDDVTQQIVERGLKVLLSEILVLSPRMFEAWRGSLELLAERDRKFAALDRKFTAIDTE